LSVVKFEEAYKLFSGIKRRTLGRV
jgi:hypothetical protein